MRIIRALGVLCVGLLVFSAPIKADWIKAGPIWNDFDANRKCPAVCGSTKWDGHWKTTQTGRMSVCSCSGSNSSRRQPKTIEVDAGPIWNNFDAQTKCPIACNKRRWDGNWRTVSVGHSTCDCQ
jgi:Mannan-binding protein